MTDLHNFITHKEAWRKAIQIARDVAVATGDSDNETYWQHELDAYDDAHKSISAIKLLIE